MSIGVVALLVAAYVAAALGFYYYGYRTHAAQTAAETAKQQEQAAKDLAAVIAQQRKELADKQAQIETETKAELLKDILGPK